MSSLQYERTQSGSLRRVLTCRRVNLVGRAALREPEKTVIVLPKEQTWHDLPEIPSNHAEELD